MKWPITSKITPKGQAGVKAMKILVADDSTTNLNLITASLQKLGHEVMAANNGEHAIELFKRVHPDLIILDVVMEGLSGFECAKKIRAIDEGDWIPIIFLSGSVDDESIAKGIDAGGDDYLTKPFSEITLAAKIKAMQRISNMRQDLYQATQKLAALSTTDSLTGVYNRLQFNKTIREKIGDAQREQTVFALLFLDLDKFKSINDTLGHHAGDLLLIEVSKRLQSCLRVNDFLSRIGGDEFALLISNVKHKDDVSTVAQKMVDALSKPFKIEKHDVQTSSSIGIALFPEDGVEQKTLAKNADMAMYQAKLAGRNNYQFYSKTGSKKKSAALTENKQTISPVTSIEVSTNKKIGLLNCFVNESHICIDLQFVKQSLPLTELQIMPNSPSYFVGLMNLAGKSIPIIDLGARLNLIRQEPYNLSTPVVLCSDNSHQVGFIVDKILGLYDVETKNLQKEVYTSEADSFFLATIKLENELSLLVNMELLLAIDNNSELSR